MFFENEIISADIVDVVAFNQSNVNVFNKGRNYNALSFRVNAEAYLRAGEDEVYLTDGSVAYVPENLDYARNAKVDNLIAIHFNSENYATDSVEYFLPQNAEILHNLFVRILDCWNKKEPGYKYKATSLLYEIFGECYRQNFRLSSETSKIRKSIDYINENYRNKNLSITEIANCSFISEVYFRKLFRKEYGISPKRYIINLRLQYAANMIATGYFQLSEIADMAGYNDYKHFSTEFKKIMGVSPSEYV